MTLSTWNFEYALPIMVLLCEASNAFIHAFIHAFCHSKIHFHQCGPLKLIKTMLKSFRVLLGLSPVWNCYPKLVT